MTRRRLGAAGIVATQIALTVFVTGSVMAGLVIAVPSLRASPRAGLGVAVGIGVASFCAIVALWPSRRN